MFISDVKFGFFIALLKVASIFDKGLYSPDFFGVSKECYWAKMGLKTLEIIKSRKYL
jgi:hypothetical protein